MYKNLYPSLTYALWPALKGLTHIRALTGKDIKNRIEERYGRSKHSRPIDRKVIWIHAASNGEALSALPLIDHFQKLDHPPHIVMTTMTVTAADLLKKRVNPENFTHQFIPLDHPRWVKRFHGHWRPDMVLWIESELWPNHLREIKKRGIPALLLNARLSEKSVKNWSFAKDWFQDLLSCFSMILAQTERDKANLQKLGLSNIHPKGNLKDMAPALPFDPYAADDIRYIFESRTTLLFASTHDPEEKIARDIHIELTKDFPDLMTVIVPRHPKRGQDIAMDFKDQGLNIACRSLKMSPRPDTDIYIADTLGELGLFYHLCDVVFVGNSMGTKPGGGHNLMEPAWHHCAIVSGDDLNNFSQQATEMPEKNACLVISNQDALLMTLRDLLHDIDKRQSLIQNAYEYVSAKQTTGMKVILKAIEPTCQKAGII